MQRNEHRKIAQKNMNYFSKNAAFFLKKTSFFWDFSEKQVKIDVKKVPSVQLRHNRVNKNHKKTR
jgi:hypothetical protein